MKTFLLLFCSCLISSSSLSQDKKLSYGIHLFPHLSDGIITNEGSVPERAESAFRRSESWKPSGSINLFVEYRLNGKSAFGIGLGYQNNGEHIKSGRLQFPSTTGGPSTSYITHFDICYVHHNLEMPLYFKRYFGKRLFTQFGISGTLNVGNTIKSKMHFSDDSVLKVQQKDDFQDYRLFNIFGNLGFGFDLQITEKFTLYLLPYAQYGILRLAKSAPFNQNVLSLGISTGIRLP